MGEQRYSNSAPQPSPINVTNSPPPKKREDEDTSRELAKRDSVISLPNYSIIKRADRKETSASEGPMSNGGGIAIEMHKLNRNKRANSEKTEVMAISPRKESSKHAIEKESSKNAIIEHKIVSSRLPSTLLPPLVIARDVKRQKHFSPPRAASSPAVASLRSSQKTTTKPPKSNTTGDVPEARKADVTLTRMTNIITDAGF